MDSVDPEQVADELMGNVLARKEDVESGWTFRDAAELQKLLKTPYWETDVMPSFCDDKTHDGCLRDGICGIEYNDPTKVAACRRVVFKLIRRITEEPRG